MVSNKPGAIDGGRDSDYRGRADWRTSVAGNPTIERLLITHRAGQRVCCAARRARSVRHRTRI